MPLHAISAVYGEQGLRARLAIETARLGDPPSRQKVSEALELADDHVTLVQAAMGIWTLSRSKFARP